MIGIIYFSFSLAFDKAVATKPAGTVTRPTPIISTKKVNILPPTSPTWITKIYEVG